MCAVLAGLKEEGGEDAGFQFPLLLPEPHTTSVAAAEAAVKPPDYGVIVVVVAAVGAVSDVAAL